MRRATGYTFRSLRARNFRLFFAGQGISQTGTWMQTIATGLLVLQLTDSGLLLGLATAAQFGPTLLLGAWAGVLSDRAHRHRLLVLTQLAGAVVAGLLAVTVLSGHAHIAPVFLLTAASGVVTALESPARRAFVVELVDAGDVANAVGLNSAVMTGSRVIGPAIAGAVVAGPGIGWCFAVNALTYLPQIALFARMDRRAFRAAERVARARGQLREGLRYTWSDPHLRLPLILMAVIGLFALNFAVVLPLLALRDLGGDVSTYTALFSLMSVGSLAGALMLARRRDTSTAYLAHGAVALGVAMLALAAVPGQVAALLLVVPVGFAAVTVVAGVNTAVQLRAAPAMRGRVLALTSVVFLGSTPIGGPLLGWVAEGVGARGGLALGAAASLLAGLWVRYAIRPARTPTPQTDSPPLPMDPGGRGYYTVPASVTPMVVSPVQ